jgi:hypothetical protein
MLTTPAMPLFPPGSKTASKSPGTACLKIRDATDRKLGVNSGQLGRRASTLHDPHPAILVDQGDATQIRPAKLNLPCA